MYEMAKKAREAMRGKAKRLSGEKDSKVDSSNWTPAEPLNADAQTGMRPLKGREYKKGGKVEGAKAATHAGRKPRKSGGRAITADSLINRDQKEANESREGVKHVGGLKTGGRAKKAMGGAPTDLLKQVRGQTMGFNKGGRTGRDAGGKLPARMTDERVKNPNPSPDYSPKADASYQPSGGPSQEDKDALKAKIDERNCGGRTKRKAGGNVNFGPQEMPADKKAPSTGQQISEEKREQNASKPSRGKARHYDYGGNVPLPQSGPDARMGIVNKNMLNFGPGAAGSPYKKGGAAKHDDEAMDRELINKMVKPSARTGKKDGGEKWIAGAIGKKGALHKALHVPQGEKIPQKKLEKAEASSNPKLAKRARLAETLKGFNRPGKFGGGALGALNMGPAKADGGSAKGKGKTNINIMINPGQPANDQMAGMPGIPGMPPGMPPRPPGGVPVPMGMPPAGAAPAPAAMPMPSMPMPAPGGAPMARKAGGKVYRSYKDMDAGAGSGLGRLEKTEIEKRKA